MFRGVNVAGITMGRLAEEGMGVAHEGEDGDIAIEGLSLL